MACVLHLSLSLYYIYIYICMYVYILYIYIYSGDDEVSLYRSYSLDNICIYIEMRR